jgi:hypothetical protein
MEFIQYRITSDSIYLGERPKGNIFKPCTKTIPFSQISGALNKKFASSTIKAVGYLIEATEFNRSNYLIYSPRDRYSSISKVPLQIEFLVNMSGKVFVLKNQDTQNLPDQFEISLGGMRSKGFGRSRLTKESVESGSKVAPGVLNVRIPVEEMGSFNIGKIFSPVYGYLFKPLPGTFTGRYVLSLFEGSEVVAPSFLLKGQGGIHG